MSSGKILLSLVASFAAGSALGILFAPEKGKSLRRRISHKRDVFVDELEGKFNDFIDTVTNKFETVKDEATHMVHNGKAKAEEFASKAHSASK